MITPRIRPIALILKSSRRGRANRAVVAYIVFINVAVGASILAICWFLWRMDDRPRPAERKVTSGGVAESAERQADDTAAVEPAPTASELDSDATATDDKTIPLPPSVGSDDESQAEQTQVDLMIAEVRQAAQQLLDRLPNSPDALEMMARLRFFLGETAQAADCWNQALQRDPTYAYAFDGLGRIASKKGKHEEAADLFREALKFQPALHETRQRLADALFHLQQFDAAVEALEFLLSQTPDSLEARLLLGKIQLQQQQFEAAKRQFTRAIKLAPEYPRAHYGLGMACRRLGEMELARKHLKQSAVLQAENRDADDARAIFHSPEVMRSELAKILGGIGRLQAAIGDRGRAEQLWRLSVSWDDRQIDSRTQLVAMLLAADRKGEAVAAAQEMTRVETRDPKYYCQAALFLAQLGDFRQAEQLLAKCRDVGPDLGWTYRESVQFYLATNLDPEQAALLAIQAAELDPSEINLRLLSDALDRVCDSQSVKEHVGITLGRVPKDSPLRELLDRFGSGEVP